MVYEGAACRIVQAEVALPMDAGDEALEEIEPEEEYYNEDDGQDKAGEWGEPRDRLVSQLSDVRVIVIVRFGVCHSDLWNHTKRCARPVEGKKMLQKRTLKNHPDILPVLV